MPGMTIDTEDRSQYDCEYCCDICDETYGHKIKCTCGEWIEHDLYELIPGHYAPIGSIHEMMIGEKIICLKCNSIFELVKKERSLCYFDKIKKAEGDNRV